MSDMLKGTGVALITPFTDDNKVDLPALERMTQHVINGGVDYIVALGTTAETATLSDQEQTMVLSVIKKTNASRAPLVLGFGGNDTTQMLAKLEGTDCDGFCALLVVTPYYNKPSQKGLYAHYAAIAKISPLPIILYNVPSRTGVNMSAETTLALAREFKNIIAIKEASGSMEQAMKIINEAPEGFLVISGDDALAVPMCLMGAGGVISVLANSHPKECSQMIEKALSGDVDGAKKIHYSVLEMVGMLFAEGNPTGVKSALNSLGVCKKNVRLPLVKASEELDQKIRALL